MEDMEYQPLYKLNENSRILIKNMEQITDHKIYFFGSSRRIDYIDGCDLDIAMFTDNISSLIPKILSIFNSQNNFKKIVHIQKNIVIDGYKINFSDVDKNVYIELVVYDKKFKDIMLEFYKKSINMPFIISIILLCLKYLSKYGVIAKKTYYKIKVFLINNFCNSSKIVVFN